MQIRREREGGAIFLNFNSQLLCDFKFEFSHLMDFNLSFVWIFSGERSWDDLSTQPESESFTKMSISDLLTNVATDANEGNRYVDTLYPIRNKKKTNFRMFSYDLSRQKSPLIIFPLRYLPFTPHATFENKKTNLDGCLIRRNTLSTIAIPLP